MKKEIAIIGGGLGGLVCGSILAKEGYKVKILEQHYKIGGGLHCFNQFGVSFETGIHYVSGFEKDGVLRKLFSYLGILHKLNLKEMDVNGFDVLHVAGDGEKYNFGIGKDNFIRILSQKFPDEAENIRRFTEAMYAMCNKIPLFNLKPLSSNLSYFSDDLLIPVDEYIASFTNNKKLQHILSWTNTLYGGIKGVTPFYIHALVTKFFIEGASRFVEGSQQLADAMTELIVNHGGEVFTRTKITKIDVSEKSIHKLISEDGREFTADYYISDIHPSVLMDMINPQEIQRSYRERLQSLDNSYSCFTTYVKLKPNTFPYLNHTYYYVRDYETLWNITDYELDSFPTGFMLTTPPVENQGEFAEKLSLNIIMNFDVFKKWENTQIGKRGKEYEELKLAYEEKLLAMVEEVFPDFRSCIDKAFSASPLTIRDYLGTKNGSLYGYKKESNNIAKTHIMPRTKLNNLFLTGQNINLHGIIGVPLSSIVTAGEFVGVDDLIQRINSHNL